MSCCPSIKFNMSLMSPQRSRDEDPSLIDGTEDPWYELTYNAKSCEATRATGCSRNLALVLHTNPTGRDEAPQLEMAPRELHSYHHLINKIHELHP